VGRKPTDDFPETMLENLDCGDVTLRVDRDLHAITVKKRLRFTRRNKGIFVTAIFEKKKCEALVIFVDRRLEPDGFTGLAFAAAAFLARPIFAMLFAVALFVFLKLPARLAAKLFWNLFRPFFRPGGLVRPF
jgi:hypothetical protein